jgi:hypothetical protein
VEPREPALEPLSYIAPSTLWRDSRFDLDPAGGVLAEAIIELVEPPGHPPERVQRRELQPLAVGVAQPAREYAQKLHRRRGITRRTDQDRAEHEGSPHLARGEHGCRTGRAVQRRQIADHVPRRGSAPARSPGLQERRS